MICLHSFYVLTNFFLLESQQNTEPVVTRSSNGASGEQQLNGRQKRAKSHMKIKRSTKRSTTTWIFLGVGEKEGCND